MKLNEQPIEVLVVQHAGPPLLLPAVVYTALMFGGVVLLGATFRAPLDSGPQFVAHFSRELRWGTFCEFGSAIPLLIFVATVVSRLRFLRVRAAGELIALCGGVCAVAMLMLSGLSIWLVTRPGIAETAGAVRLLQSIAFAGGGPGFVAPLGLFLAGASLTAGLYRLIPRWLMYWGLGIAAACELATLTLVVWNAAFFIPVGRFGSLIWIFGVAITLPRSRTLDRSSRESSSAA